MGTVPDPLRSARLSLVTVSEEENDLRELQSSKHKQASIERNSNGFPLMAKVQSAGDSLLELNCATEAEVLRGERHCGNDINQPSMFSPGSFSPSKEGCQAALEPLNNSEQEGSNGSRDRDQATAEGQTSAHAAVKVPAAQEANQMVQTGAPGQLCGAVDKASSSSGGGDAVIESKDNDTSSLTTHSNAQRAASTAAVETVNDMTGPERTPAPASMKESETAASDLGVKSNVCSGEELKGTKGTSSLSNSRTMPEAQLKSDLDRASQPPCCAEAVDKVVPELSRFRDTGTMTMQPDGKPGAGEPTSKTHQDAEVQAVASVESKSASTSPSIFAAFLRENIPCEAKQKQEQLHVIYTGDGGKEQSEIVDRFVPLVETAPSTGIMPEVHIQASAALNASGAQAAKLQDTPLGTPDTVCLASLDNTKSLCLLASGSSQEVSVNRVEAQIAGEASNLSDISRQLSDSSVLLKTKPVYQITVNASDQPAAPPQPVNTETKLPPSMALPQFNSEHQQPGPYLREEGQPSPSSHRVSGQAKTSPGSNHGEKLQIKSDLETGPVCSQVEVKPKREEKLIPLGPKEQKATNTGTAAGPSAAYTPIVVKREQDKFLKDNKERQSSGSQNLTAGLESKLSKNSTPSLGTKVAKSSESKKGPKLDLGEKKKEPKSAMEAKAHMKQSKRIRDVVWDEQGMTWEVYGASLDPESLGIAIQNHLQRQIREHEKLIKAQSTQNRKSISSDTSSNKKLKGGRQHNVFQSMLQNFRRPNCCVRPAASSVLD